MKSRKCPTCGLDTWCGRPCPQEPRDNVTVKTHRTIRGRKELQPVLPGAVIAPMGPDGAAVKPEGLKSYRGRNPDNRRRQMRELMRRRRRKAKEEAGPDEAGPSSQAGESR